MQGVRTATVIPEFRAAALAAALVGALVSGGCKSKQGPARDATGPTASASGIEQTGTDTASPYAFPLVDRARGGLEIQWWVADDAGGAVGAALFDLADGAAPISQAQARGLIANGLRLVRVPLDRLPELQARLPAVRTLERTWFGGVLDFKPLFVGRRVESAGQEAGAVLLVDGRPERVPPGGVLRLIGRAWSAPSESGEVLRFESAVQLQTASRDDALAALNLKAAGPRTVLEEGRVFGSTALDAAFAPGHVYVIAPESPGVEWRGTASRRRAEPDEPVASSGPVPRQARTVGEAMMAFDAGEMQPFTASTVSFPASNAGDAANSDSSGGSGGSGSGVPSVPPQALRRNLKALVVIIPR